MHELSITRSVVAICAELHAKGAQVRRVVGMALLSVAIAIPLKFSAGYFTWMRNGIAAAIGSFTCVLGAYVVYQIGFVAGLLTG